MRLGYNTNGFAHHRLEDALEILAETGYSAVALTPDVHHLPPFESTPRTLADLRARLERLDLAPVVETGARFVLDPRRKHRPNLLEGEAEGRRERLRLLVRCAEIAAELGGETISTWSGVLPEGVGREEAWEHLVVGVAELCRRVEGTSVRVAFEPEPGMLVETLAGWERLRDAVGHPSLGLTLDVGHVPCTASIPVAEAIRRHSSELINVHLDDVRGAVHDHLQIGEGELDFPAILRALEEVDYGGVASVELSRHSHTAPEAARRAWEELRSRKK
jgi:L-ribulose-5-phosphate 3-epimerase